MQNAPLRSVLDPLVAWCTEEDPASRPSLASLATCLHNHEAAMTDEEWAAPLSHVQEN